ncbi:hypothetical protein GCM10020331_004780 [Ectobacillus funiculus]
MNYIINVRQGLFALAAACGIDTPRKFNRDHIVFKDADGKVKKGCQNCFQFLILRLNCRKEPY